MATYKVVYGDVREIVGLGVFDGCLSDPPYGLSFMGSEWDRGVPPSSVWGGILGVLKPGAHLLAFGGTRTHHRLMCAIEDAGFEIRDCMMYLYGSGFPKSHDISKAIDRAAGAEREVIGEIQDRWTNKGSVLNFSTDRPQLSVNVVGAPATDDAIRWDGYGTALKPAYEPIVLAMKPCDGTFAENALKHGVAGLAIDACRIPSGQDHRDKCESVIGLDSNRNGKCYGEWAGERESSWSPAGRWPANVILDQEAAELLDEQSVTTKSKRSLRGDGIGKGFNGSDLPFNTMRGFDDSGGASRFFYTAKADPSERAIGGVKNNHPCVKPIDLCAYLAKLILPPERDTPRRLLVPFAGSGSEMIGALRAGWDEVIGVEISPEYCEIARRRIAGDAPLLNVELAS